MAAGGSAASSAPSAGGSSASPQPFPSSTPAGSTLRRLGGGTGAPPSARPRWRSAASPAATPGPIGAWGACAPFRGCALPRPSTSHSITRTVDFKVITPALRTGADDSTADDAPTTVPVTMLSSDAVAPTVASTAEAAAGAAERRLSRMPVIVALAARTGALPAMRSFKSAVHSGCVALTSSARRRRLATLIRGTTSSLYTTPVTTASERAASRAHTHGGAAKAVACTGKPPPRSAPPPPRPAPSPSHAAEPEEALHSNPSSAATPAPRLWPTTSTEYPSHERSAASTSGVRSSASHSAACAMPVCA
mmetsp:Transcript_19260/g.68026  ORF Transcript_19260/g.68026 Transcript_19260/m.68026 type:complete len:307 (+) Transcript_19260:531-1451(+)